MGGYVYPETPDGYSAYGTDFDIRPGYRTGEGRAEDLAEAKRLVAEVHPNGWKEPLDFLVRGLQEGSYEITLAQAVQQMFVQDFGWTMEIRRTDPSKWIEDAREGKFTMTAGNIVSVTDDPVRLLPRLVRRCVELQQLEERGVRGAPGQDRLRA